MTRGATFETLERLDADLAARGHHPLTPFWRRELARWYAHPTARTLVGRVGRGGAKSHTSVKVALNETLFGDWQVPPGEVHYWGYASTSTPEAYQRLNLLERMLLDLGIKHTKSGDELVLRDQPRGWRVFAATVGAVSGFRAFGFSGDELSKWHSRDTYANPAAEVIASMNAMAVTHPRSRRLLISSPLGLDDFHAERFKLGETRDQIVVQAPSWVANPGVSEADCRASEPDPRVFAREYEAIPQAAKLAAFDAAAVERAFAMQVPRSINAYGRFGLVDVSSGKKDTFAYAVAGWREVAGLERLVVEHVDGVEGRFFEQSSGEKIVADIAGEFKARGVYEVFGDQRESMMVSAAFARHGLSFREKVWTAPAKERAVATVRRWFAEGRLVLPPHARLRGELLSFEERITSSGAFTFGARGTGHDDYVAVLLTAAMADLDGELAGSPSHYTLTDAIANLSDEDMVALRRGFGMFA